MNYQNQLTLLSDILKNQQEMGFGTPDEFSQMYRLTQSLQEQNNFHPSIQETLTNIANYCENGKCDNTIELNEWVQFIDQLSLQ